MWTKGRETVLTGLLTLQDIRDTTCPSAIEVRLKCACDSIALGRTRRTTLATTQKTVVAIMDSGSELVLGPSCFESLEESLLAQAWGQPLGVTLSCFQGHHFIQSFGRASRTTVECLSRYHLLTKKTLLTKRTSKIVFSFKN